MKQIFKMLCDLVFNLKEGERVPNNQAAGLAVVLVLILAILTVARL